MPKLHKKNKHVFDDSEDTEEIASFLIESDDRTNPKFRQELLKNYDVDSMSQ